MKDKLIEWLHNDYEVVEGQIVNRYGGVVYQAKSCEDYIEYVCGEIEASTIETYSEIEQIYFNLDIEHVLTFGEWLDEVFDKVETGLNPA